MRVLALASYPVEAATTRYRLEQFVAPLAERGITMMVYPFLDSELFTSLYSRKEMPRTVALGVARSALGRLGDILKVREADVLLVQREAMMFGPPIIEWLATRMGRCPMVLDLDDATYVPIISPRYGRLGSALKWFGKTDDLIRWAQVVTCGNRSIAEYVTSKGRRAVIIPTVVDTERFRPAGAKREAEGPPVLGWIGTYSTYPYLKSIFPAIEQLARKYRFRLKVVGAGQKEIGLPGVDVENLYWSLNRELEDFQSFDVGLYPIDAGLYTEQWTRGRSGFKAIQYMAVGIPYVVTPFGACAEIGEPNMTHLCASTQDEWCEALGSLLTDRVRRERMGRRGRQHATEHYTVAAQADKLAQVLHDAVAGS
jgi:glycosyltransferase involved in cell wall biosynthesis